MKTLGKNRGIRILALAGALLAAGTTARAEPASARGTLEIISSSGEKISAPSGSRRGEDRGDRNRPRRRRDHSPFLLRAPIFRWDTRVAQVVHVTGNARLNMTRSRTYVKGYRVEDGFLIPVLGTVTDGVIFGVPKDTHSQERPSRPAPDYLLRDPREAEHSAQAENPPEPTVITERRPAAIRTTSLVGTLQRNAEGQLEFLAAHPSGEDIHYEMLSPEPAEKVLAEAGADALRVILIGKVNDEDPRAVIRVTAAYALATPGE